MMSVKHRTGLPAPLPGARQARAWDPSRTRILPPAVAAFLVLLCLGTCVPAMAQRPAMEAYSQALRLSQQEGDYPAAVDMLWKIVREHGQDPIVEDALFQIGELSERRTGEFDRAEEAYTLLLERVPPSRNHARAKQRLERLRQDRSSGDEPLRILNEIRAGFSGMGEDAALARLRDLYRDWPDFVRRDDVIYMIAEADYRRKDYDAALRGYEELVRSFPESDRVYYVLGKIGKTHIERRDFDAAMEAFERVAAYEETTYGARRSWDDQVRQVTLFRTLQTLFLLSLCVSGAALAVWLCGTRWRAVNGQVLKRAAVPVGVLSALFLLAASFASKKPPAYASTLLATWVALGGAAFLNHLFVGTRPLGLTGRLLAAAGAFVAAVAVVYAVYYRLDMVNLLYDSILNSMESGEW